MGPIIMMGPDEEKTGLNLASNDDFPFLSGPNIEAQINAERCDEAVYSAEKKFNGEIGDPQICLTKAAEFLLRWIQIRLQQLELNNCRSQILQLTFPRALQQ